MLAHDTGPKPSFERMKQARAFKNKLKRLTSNDEAYYSVLARFHKEHFNTSPSTPYWQDPEKLEVKILEALQMEVNVHAWSAGTPNESPKMFIAFTSHADIEELRQAIKLLSGDDEEAFYFRTLHKNGCMDAAGISTQKIGAKILRKLALERNRLREDVGLLKVLEAASNKLGARLFADILTRHDCKTLAEVLALMADPLTALLKELEFFVKEQA